MHKQTRVIVNILLLLLFCTPVRAEESSDVASDDKPWTLDSNNWQLGQALLPEPVLNRVKKGEYWYRVIPVDPQKFKQNYSAAFWTASEANAGKYEIDPSICGLTETVTGKMPGFFFGYPFPRIDPADPQAGCKIAWNFEAASLQGNGGGATFTLNGVDSGGEFRRIKLWAQGMSFLGRHGGAVDNPENLRSTGMANVLEPQDIDGVAGLTKRPNTPTAQDQAWFYVPATRRVRRVNAASRSDPVAGLDLFGDDLNCYGGKTEYYKWKLIGEGKILAPVVQPYPFVQRKVGDTRWAVDIPYLKGGYEVPGAKGAPWLIVENLSYIVRPVWIVEGQSEDPYYNFGKVIMYFDKDLYRIYWKLVHNRAGEYFYNAQCSYHWSRDAQTGFSAVTQNSVVGVNDKTNRAAFGGRYDSQFIEHNFEDAHFTLHHLTHMGD